MVINKNKLKTHSPTSPFLSRLNFIPFFLSLLPPAPLSQVQQVDGDGRLWSAHNTLSLSLLPSHAVPLLQHGIRPTRDSPSRTALVWVLPMRYSPSGTNFSSTGPLQCHKSCQETCSSPWAAGPARSLFQYSISMSCSVLQNISTAVDCSHL